MPVERKLVCVMTAETRCIGARDAGDSGGVEVVAPSPRPTRRRVLHAAAATLATAGVFKVQLAAAQEGAAAPSRDAPISGRVLDALQTSRAWINYAPAKPFDFVVGKHPVTEEQLQTELEMLYGFGFRGLVTNAMTYGLEAAPRVAKRIGFQYVIAKLWWANDPTLEIEKRNVERAIADIDALVMGNETVHKAVVRGEDSDKAVRRLQREIEGLQRSYHKPVTTGLHRDDWARYPEIATQFGDFVFPNLQPWWVQLRNNPETAAKWVVEALQVIRDTPGMPGDRVIVIQEAAYPSAALPQESAPGATPSNQKLFVQRLIESGVPFIYGFSFDAWFARKNSPPGGFGGLWDDERKPKPVVAALNLQPYAEAREGK
jgi:hypothetical protein